MSDEEVEAVCARAQAIESQTKTHRVLPTQHGPAEIRFVGGELEAPTRDFFLVETVSVKISGNGNN